MYNQGAGDCILYDCLSDEWLGSTDTGYEMVKLTAKEAADDLRENPPTTVEVHYAYSDPVFDDE